METPSRRNVLMAGGTLGAVGALTAAAPTQAWAWSPLGSVAGAGAGVDPRHVWDEEADTVVAALFKRREVSKVNLLLKLWTKNGQPLPLGLPKDLRDFIERARKLPSWYDQKKINASNNFNAKRGLYLGVTYGFVSGMMSTVIPREARAVYYSKGGADMRDRITKTAKLGYDIGTSNAFQLTGEMIVTCVKTRLAHAGVRYLLPQSPYWSQVADEQIPISQWDKMVTWHSLPTTVMRQMQKWKVPINPTEAEGFLHSWQVTAHMLGIKDEYIPKSWAEADAQADQMLTPSLGPTPEGVKLADTLVNLASFIDGGVLSEPVLVALTRYTLGTQIADDWLKLRKTPAWDELLNTAWEPFIAVREGLLKLEKAPGPVQQSYWLFDEILRQAVLLVLSGARYPISIQIPTGNNPNY